MFLLNLQSKIPIYEQIQQQFLKFIETGILKPRDRLPSVRQLAKDNGINPNTVAKAYSELEAAGYVYNLPKKGVYVAEVDERVRQESHVQEILQSLKEQGVTKENLLEVIEQLYQKEEEVC